MKRAMALDVGEKRIGIAVSDPLGIAAHPLSTINRDEPVVFDRIADLICEYGVGTLVVGMPYELEGYVGEQAKRTEVFCSRLRQHCRKRQQHAPEKSQALADFRLVTWDERLTTAQAERAMAGSKLKNRDRSAALDRIAAALILEGYLNSSVPQQHQ